MKDTTKEVNTSETEVIWKPQPRQERALSCPADELFFGGAAGGGKSDYLLAAFTRGVQYGKKYKGVIFRKSYKELEELQERAHDLFGPIGGQYLSTVRTWTFPDPKGGEGAVLKFRHLENDLDVHDYQGHQYQYIAFDELTNWATDYCYVYMFSRLRSPHGIPCKMRAAGNPGGAGHQWVKKRFIDPSPSDVIFTVKEFLNGVEFETTRCFIPSKLEDNMILMENDPRYEQRMAMLPPHLYRALREGDWNVFEGQVFSEFTVDKHVIEPFPLDPGWFRFCSMDWGYSKPFSIGWWAVTGDGRMIRYREWYGKGENDDQGVEMSAHEVAKRAMELSAPEGVRMMVADPACWNNQGTGTTIADAFMLYGWNMEKAVNDRVNGLINFHNKLKAKGEDGRPQMLIFNTCSDFIRTIPMLPYDPRHPEDVDCLIAGSMVETECGPVAIEDVSVGTMVDTPIGYREVTAAYDSGESETVWIELESGERIEGTPHHKLYVEGEGLVPLREIRRHDILTRRSILWGKRVLYIAALLTHGTMGVFITTLTGLLSLMAGLRFIGRYGSTLAMRFLKGIMSTTLMGITTIIPSRILSAFPRANIVASTSRKDSRENLERGSGSGERAKRGRGFFGTMLAKCERERRRNVLRASIVGNLLLRDTLIKFFVLLSAPTVVDTKRSKRRARYVAKDFGQKPTPGKRPKRARIVAVGRSGGKRRVYNITVDEAHLFYVNGILSANTKAEDHVYDEARYAVMSRMSGTTITYRRNRGHYPERRSLYSWIE